MINNLKESLDGNDRIKQLVKNPLLLTTVGLIHRYQDTLPKRRYQLYDKAVNTLLKSWDRTAKGLREQQTNLFKVLDIDDDLRRVMSLLAKWIHEQYATQTTEGGTLIREKDLIEQVSAIIQADHDIKPHRAEEEAKRFVQFIRDRTGLINEYGRGLYGFVHKTFQEYLTAEAIQSEARYDFGKILTFIRTHLHQPHWREVILLLVAQQEEKGAAQAIETILNAQSDYEQWLHRDLLLVGECLTEDPPRLRKANQQLVEEILHRLVALVVCDKERVGQQVQYPARSLLRRLRNTDFQADALAKLKAQGNVIDRWELLTYQFYLGELETAIAQLLILPQEPDADIRGDAAALIGKLGNTSAEVLPALLELLKDQNPNVRSRAAESLGKLGHTSVDIVPELLGLLKDQNSNVRSRAAESLGKLSYTSIDVVAPALLGLLRDEDLDVRSRAAESLGKLGNTSSEVVPELLRLLKDQNSDVRSRAAESLGKLGNAPSEVVQALLGLLKDQNSDVRSRAAESLGKLGNASSEVVKALLDLLKDQSPRVRFRTAESLGELGNASSEVVQALLDLLKNQDFLICYGATLSLGKMGNTSSDVIQVLLGLLKDQDPLIRYSAVSSLGKLGNASTNVIQALMNLLTDQQSYVRSRVTDSLVNLGKVGRAVLPALVQWLSAQPEDRELGAAIDALVRLLV